MEQPISVFVKPLIASSNFRTVFSLAKDLHDEMARFRIFVQTGYDKMGENGRASLSAAFVNTPESFDRVLSLCFVTIGEIFNQEFAGDQTRGAKQHLVNIPLLVVALLPCNHKYVAKNKNQCRGALADQAIGCPRLAKYYQLLNRAAKDLMAILVSIVSDKPAVNLFFTYQLTPRNIKGRCEETRAALRKHYLIHGNVLMKRWVQHIGSIGNVPPSTPRIGGAVTAAAGGILFVPHHVSLPPSLLLAPASPISRSLQQLPPAPQLQPLWKVP
jgi:hypothetical protein